MENWNQVKEILELAIDQPPDQRARFIEERCSGDVDLRKKVDSLINSYEKIGSFMEDGAIGSVAETFKPAHTEFQPGEKLGHYSIVRVLGEGGMGKVYLAEDLDLHRNVAIKVLRNDLWWYKQARQRLLREARAAARLDHPNICAIFEIEDTDERSFIVMQYIVGDTLADVMDHGGLGARQSLRVALQIASALEEAHSHHIIHRDIKPANIIINEKGQAKVLDFGLAKSIEPRDKANDNDISSAGAVMGTVPYMSPEQLRGKTVDGRSDIFSFGALLYEMVSGRQVFGRESNAETISAILNDEPDLSVIPQRFRDIIRRSLMKNTSDRYQSISALVADLRAMENDTEEDPVPIVSRWLGAQNVISSAFRRYFSGRTPGADTAGAAYYRWQDSDSNARTVRLTEPLPPTHTTESHPITSRKSPVFLMVAAALAVLAIPTAFFLFSRITSDPHKYDSLHSVQLAQWKDAGSGVYLGYSSSHDGRMIAYSSRQEGPYEGVYVKPIAGGDEVRVTKDQWNNYSPIWSPDDQRLAFVSFRNNAHGIYIVPFSGGEAKLVEIVDPGLISLRHWSNDGSSIYYELRGNLFRVDISSRNSQPLTSFDQVRAPRRDFSFSPDEKTIVFSDVVEGQTDLWLMPAAGGAPTRLTNDPEVENHPVWHPDGKRIVYGVVRDGRNQINAAFLDGHPPEQITRGDGEHQLVDVSRDGSNIFYTTWEDRSDVWSVNAATGRESPVTTGKESEFWSEVSPNGRLLLYQTTSGVEALSTLTTTAGFVVKPLSGAEPPEHVAGYNPKWSPDGTHITFLRWQGAAKQNALWSFDTVSGEERELVDSGIATSEVVALPYDRRQAREFSWSPDGRELVFPSVETGTSNIVEKNEGTQDVLLTDNSDRSVKYYSPIFSPSGQRLAFVSRQTPTDENHDPLNRVWIEESGVLKEIYSSEKGLRLLGWDGNDDLVLAVTKGILRSDPSDLQILHLSLNGIARSTVELQNVYVFSSTLSPNGKFIAFTCRENERDDIFTIPTSGAQAKKVSANNDPRIYYGSLAWSPDGETIYFDKQERIDTISMFENFK